MISVGFPGDLWDAEVKVEQVDLAKSSVVLVFTQHHSDRTSVRRLQLKEVTELNLCRDPRPVWDFAESSEMGIYDRGTDLELGIVLWGEPNELLIRCHEIWLDDVLLAASR